MGSYLFEPPKKYLFLSNYAFGEGFSNREVQLFTSPGYNLALRERFIVGKAIRTRKGTTRTCKATRTHSIKTSRTTPFNG